MDRELSFMLELTRRLPRLRHMSGVVNRVVKPFYLRKRRDPVVAEVFGIKMELEPSECVDGWLLFCPQLYDRDEVQFVSRSLRVGDVFLDVGANIGYYSLLAAGAVGAAGRVLAIEADPYNWGKLVRNVRLNGFDNISAMNVGVSDNREVLRLTLNTTGNRGGNSFLGDGTHGVNVECLTLLEILQANRVASVQCAKLDIEGFEYRVLRRFLKEAPITLYPRFLVIEHDPVLVSRAGGDALALLRDARYRTVATSGYNWLMEHQP